MFAAATHWLSTKRIEWRARSIRDPIQRLKYLRQGNTGRPAGGLWGHWRSRCLSAVLLGGILLAPGYTGSAVHETLSDLRGSAQPALNTTAADRVPDVWLVEEKTGYEVFSNGLRLETRFTTAGDRRSYPAFPLQGAVDKPELRRQPVGIVYHTTESHIAPFDRGHNARMRYVGRWLLEYIHNQQAYHFLIDRFGRVHRIVEETGAANHAGASVWADRHHAYVNLNHSFLGVAFEAQTQAGAPSDISAPQIHAARMLTEMLRSKYVIAAANCVTHAQVSVAESLSRLGNHLDWAGHFPFEEIGLPDNYGLAAPGVYVFGLTYNTDLVNVTGPRFWKGLLLGDDQLRQDAAAQRMHPAQYRAALQERYRKMMAALPRDPAGESRPSQESEE